MEFGWINGINLTVVILLILINIVAFKTGATEGFRQIRMHDFYGTSDLDKELEVWFSICW